MNANLTPTSSMVRRGRVAVAVLAAAVALAAGCGSDDTATTNTAKPAGAKENTTTAQCFTWTYPTVSTTPAPCAVDAQGPGGGRIFYDAGSQQSWGRFLEVAPQNWNGTLYYCAGEAFGSSCGTFDKSKIEKKTSDAGPNDDKNTGKPGNGYYPCGKDSDWHKADEGSEDAFLPGAAANLPRDIGTGKANTAVLLNTTQCTTSQPSAAKLAADYRGGGFTDWFIPSYNEMQKLWAYTGRNQIGGFPTCPFGTPAHAELGCYYATSSTEPYNRYDGTISTGRSSKTGLIVLNVHDPYTTSPLYDTGSPVPYLVRPIRAF